LVGSRATKRAVGVWGRSDLEFLHEITVRPSSVATLLISWPRSYSVATRSAQEMTDVKGKVAICFGARRAGMTTGAQRLEAAAKAGAIGIINVDDPGFTIEPSRWPKAYARASRSAKPRPRPIRIWS